MKRLFAILLIAFVFLTGCQNLPKAKFEICVDCHHSRTKCPQLSAPVRSPVDIEILFDKSVRTAKLDVLRKKILELKEVKSLELIPSEVALKKFQNESPSLEIKLFRAGNENAILRSIEGAFSFQVFLKMPTTGELARCGTCHKKAMKYDIHPRHAKATCKTCHKK